MMSSSTMPAARSAPALTDERLAQLREMLEQQRDFRLDQLGQLYRYDDRPAHTDVDREITRSLIDGARAALRDVRAALRRMDVGSYGRCLHCEAPLTTERLEVLPQAALCMSCQRAAEVV
ncbi:MAG: hypothetical protein JWO57_553 [Pseudonocardiales bacterium]|nr:hypothetical protein [Pseudonocardiales bacterium]